MIIPPEHDGFQLEDVTTEVEEAKTCLPLDCFSGETCYDCGATSNQLFNQGYWCSRCGAFNISTKLYPSPLFENPDWGVSISTIHRGYYVPNLQIYGDTIV